MKNATMVKFAAAFALLAVCLGLGVIGGVIGLTRHPVSKSQARAIVHESVGETNLKSIAVQQVYQLAEQQGVTVTSAKATKVKVDGNKAIVTVKLVTVEAGKLTLALSFTKGLWQFVTLTHV